MMVLPDGPIEHMQSGTLMRMLIEYQHALGLLSYCAAPEAIEMRHTFSLQIRRIEQILLQRSSMDGLEPECMVVARPAASTSAVRYTAH